MNEALSKIKEQFLKVLPPTIFFFVTFHVIALVHNLILKGEGVTATTTVSALMVSLVLGKVVLIADRLPFINRYPEKPLIYNVLWKTAVYTVISIAIHYVVWRTGLYTLVSIAIHSLEHLFEHSGKAGSPAQASRKLLDQIVWPRFVAVQIMLVVLIFVYCVARELTRVLGPHTVRELFLGKPRLLSAAARGAARKA
jgi:hypothetical protein